MAGQHLPLAALLECGIVLLQELASILDLSQPDCDLNQEEQPVQMPDLIANRVNSFQAPLQLRSRSLQPALMAQSCSQDQVMDTLQVLRQFVAEDGIKSGLASTNRSAQTTESEEAIGQKSQSGRITKDFRIASLDECRPVCLLHESSLIPGFVEPTLLHQEIRSPYQIVRAQ